MFQALALKHYRRVMIFANFLDEPSAISFSSVVITQIINTSRFPELAPGRDQSGAPSDRICLLINA